MAEHKQIVSYDYTKVIKDIVVSTAFIPGLQNVYYRYVSEFYEKPEDLGALLTKFHGIVDGKITGEDAAMTPIEHEIYTIFSLTHLFKSFAKDQDLEILTDLPVDNETLKKYAEEAKKAGSLDESLNILANKINTHLPDAKEEETEQ
tara:strand:- start:1757 stop:2197 length:441 start_codon:yes stop_codon:yes gene_type:complete